MQTGNITNIECSKTFFLHKQESGGGKHPPLAGPRKHRAGSLAAKKFRRRKSTSNVEDPVEGEIRLVEVTYAGTHEKAPY
jgi:hypothetical protein